MEIILVKTISGLLPADPQSHEAYGKIKGGEAFRCDIKKIRNYRFLKKYFALLNIGYDNWNPPSIKVDNERVIPLKNFDRFRHDVAILSGYYHSTIRLDGTIRIEAKSISFASMGDDEFADLYSKTIDVFIKHIYGSKHTKEDIDHMVEEYLRFV